MDDLAGLTAKPTSDEVSSRKDEVAVTSPALPSTPTAPASSDLPAAALKTLLDAGMDPEAFEIKSAWPSHDGTMLYSFKPRTPGAASAASLTDAELHWALTAKRIERHAQKGSQEPKTALVLLGDFQYGKNLDGDGILGTLSRVESGLENAHAEVERRIENDGDIERVVIGFLGDHIEGFVSQGGANAWRTPMPLSEQIRVTRRTMLHAMETFNGLNAPLSMVAIPGNHGECLADDHELLTREGWVRVSEFDGSNEIATYNRETGGFEWQAPTSWYAGEHDGEMVSVRTANIDMLVTPNHDMWTTKHTGHGPIANQGNWRKVKADELIDHGGLRLVQRAATSWAGQWTTPEGAPNLSPEKLARFLGWYVAEGWTDHRGDYRVHMAQSPAVHPVNYDEICSLIEDMGLKPDRQWNQVRFSHAPTGRFLVKNFGVDSGTKRLPEWLKAWPSEMLEVFLAAYLAGDGHRVSSTCWSVKSKSERLLGDLQEVAMKTGRIMSIGKRREYPVAGTKYVGVATEASFVERPVSSHAKKHVSKVPYSGTVYCPTVPNGLIFTRRKGKIAITGNSFRPNGKGITRYDDSHDTEALIAVADAAKVSKAYRDVEFYVPQTDDLTVVLNCSGTFVAFNHGHMSRGQNKLMEWVKGQAFNRSSPYAGVDLAVFGHYHSFDVQTDGDRMALTVPSMESESTWYKHKTGTGGDPGLLVAYTGQGRTDEIKMIR